MRRDVKTGMFIGLVLTVAGAVAILATKDQSQGFSVPVVPTTSTEENEDGRLRDNPETAVPFTQQPVSDEVISPEPVAERPIPGGLIPIKTTRFHIVQQGETLSSIAKRYYGTTTAVGKILEANRQTIQTPDRIRPGMKITIPD